MRILFIEQELVNKRETKRDRPLDPEWIEQNSIDIQSQGTNYEGIENMSCGHTLDEG